MTAEPVITGLEGVALTIDWEMALGALCVLLVIALLRNLP
jgi:hypothetical protein